MKKDRISNNVIRRLPMYLHKLDELMLHSVDRVSSAELGRQLGLTPSQIRQDFSCFGEFGLQGYGYRVEELRRHISRILGIDKGFSAIIVGVGNLGHALVRNMNFEELGFTLKAAFDSDPNKIGEEISGLTIYDSASLVEWLKVNPAELAVLTVSRKAAKPLAATLASCGIRGIWNFTNTDLELEDSEVVVEDIRFADSLLFLGYHLSRQKEGSSNGD